MPFTSPHAWLVWLAEYLMSLHFHVEVALVPVCYKNRIWQTIRKLFIYGFLPSWFILIYICQCGGLEDPVPMQFLANRSIGLIRSCDRQQLHPPAYLLIGGIRFPAALLDYILYGAFTYSMAENVRKKFWYSFERYALYGIQIRYKRTITWSGASADFRVYPLCPGCSPLDKQGGSETVGTGDCNAAIFGDNVTFAERDDSLTGLTSIRKYGKKIIVIY